MNAWQKIGYTLVMAFLAGATFAAAAALPESAAFSVVDTPSQTKDAPVDCKKKPDDPRCKGKPY